MLEPFQPSQNKNIIRKEYDKPLIKEHYDTKHRKLAYFGLPAEPLYDILEWEEYLDRYTAVEKGDPEEPHRKQSLVMLNAHKYRISANFQLLRGDLDDILIDGKDNHDQIPHYPFDIANLDYFGGILHGGSKRVQAIEKFIEKQMSNDFLLIMTFDVREEDSGEKIRTLDRIKKELIQFDASKEKEITDFINWYKREEVSDAYRQKVYVPYFIKISAEAKLYSVYVYEPILYEGTKKAPMVHFVCRLTYEPQITVKSVSDQSLLDILNLKMKEVKDGKIIDSQIQAPMI